jgi:hypothetical protein
MDDRLSLMRVDEFEAGGRRQCVKISDLAPEPLLEWADRDAHVGMARASDLLQRVLGHRQVRPAVGPAGVRDARVKDEDRDQAAIVL